MWKFIGFTIILGNVYADRSAVVYLSDPSGTGTVAGNVTFTKTGNTVIVTGTITGLKEGNHGFHIHNLGHIAPGCIGTGGHFNPHNQTHGGPNDTVRHVGDLGNVVANASGIASINFTDTVIDLVGEHNIIGRAVVVHEDADDLGKGGNSDSLITGNAGNRLACGVIGILDQPSSSNKLKYSSSLMMTVVIILVLAA